MANKKKPTKKKSEEAPAIMESPSAVEPESPKVEETPVIMESPVAVETKEPTPAAPMPPSKDAKLVAKFTEEEVNMLHAVRNHPQGSAAVQVGQACNVTREVAFGFFNKMTELGIFRFQRGKHANLYFLTMPGTLELGKHCL